MAATKPKSTGKSNTISDPAVTKATGKGWDHWFKVLDRFDVKKNGHAPAAKHLHEKHGTGDWWSQMIVVQYERARGLREKHQKPDGFQISAARTIAAPVGAVYKAWQGRGRAAWLKDDDFAVRTAKANTSMRITWVDGTSTVEVMFYNKGKAGAPKCQVTVQHGKLRSAAEGAKMKKYWGAALDRLRGVLGA